MTVPGGNVNRIVAMRAAIGFWLIFGCAGDADGTARTRAIDAARRLGYVLRVEGGLAGNNISH